MDVVKGFKPELLLFAAFFAVMPFSSSSYTVFRLSFDPADQLIGPFATAVLLAGAVAGLAAALVAARGKGRLFLHPVAVWVGAGCLVAGYGTFFVLLAAAAPSPLTVPAALLTALGGVEMCIAWGSLMACFGLRRAIFWVALTAGGGSFVVLMLSSVDPVVALLAFALLTIAGVVVPCARAKALGRAVAVEAAPMAAEEADAPAADDGSSETRPALPEESPEKVDERR